MIQRAYLQQLKDRMNEDRKFIQVIVGPRQVGKTTMVNQFLQQTDKEYIFESADTVAATNSTWINQIYDSARSKMNLNNLSELLIIIDEIQKIDNWSETIKLNWDKDTNENRNIKLIILGSSRLLIQKGLTESLAGRFEKTYISHWSYYEMQKAFNFTLNEYIYYGGYPGSASLINDEKRWKTYIHDSLIETSISKDILMLTRIDKPALLKQLFELGSIYSGQILSLTKIIGQMQDAGNTTTLTHYLNLLSDSGLLSGISKYASQTTRKRASIPKFQVYNNALLTAQNNDTFNSAINNQKTWGRLVESAVGTHLLNYSITEKYNLYYWREGNFEVDFIIEYRSKVIGIEVKSGHRAENKGMSVFANKFNPEKIIIIGTSGISIEEFLLGNPIKLFE